MSLCHDGNYDLSLFDLMIPKLDGRGVLRRIYAAKDTPVLVLTAVGGTQPTIESLNTGVDVSFGQLTLDASEQTVRSADEIVESAGFILRLVW